MKALSGFMIRLSLAAVLAGIAPFVFADQVFTVPAELWDRPRTARIVLDQPQVRGAVDKYISRPGSNLVIHHAAGQDPLLHAEELRSWLIALAVSPERIRLSGSLKSGEALKIEVMP